MVKILQYFFLLFTDSITFVMYFYAKSFYF